MNFIEYYLNLQKKVFSEMFDYEIHFDEAVANYFIPKLLIQPFVENSIVHAAEVSDKRIHINIASGLFNDRVFIIIKDNGPGIDSETLNRLTSITSKVEKWPYDVTTGNYAIKNIQQRLKLYFGDLFELNIISTAGEGTKIEMILPILLDSNINKFKNTAR
jgi:two-component system sensor histidine kinase YesM